VINVRAAGARIGLALLVLVFVIAGCADGSRPAARQPTVGGPTSTAPRVPPATSAPGVRCGEASLADKTVSFATPAGASLAGYLLGTGGTGIVLAPQRRLDSCSFLPYAQVLAGRGYRVLAFDFTGEGGSSAATAAATPSSDVVAAVAYLRSKGVSRVVLLGTSRGGTAALVAAAATPPIAAVVSVSSPAVFSGEDARAAAAKLTAAALYIAADGDQGFNDDARALYQATPGDRRKLLLVAGSQHGIGLLRRGDPAVAEVDAAISGFLATYAPAA
jgi:pimeloyl-ACP methyl ester carboxylesterase